LKNINRSYYSNLNSLTEKDGQNNLANITNDMNIQLYQIDNGTQGSLKLGSVNNGSQIFSPEMPISR
jgi:hypothetical protein